MVCSYVVSTYLRSAWAKDESSSIDDEVNPVNGVVQNSEFRTSTAHSRISSISGDPSRWLVFNDPQNRIEKPVGRLSLSPRSERRSFRDISLAWIPSSIVRKNTGSFTRKGKDVAENISPQSTKESAEPHTLTPWLRTPWTAIRETPGPSSSTLSERNDYREIDDRPSREENHGLRKTTLRSFILTNIYIPLVSRYLS
jgi:hypothetical protein